ncbi:hypothetical protein FJTKL_04054 [Diaporthe vaccinii]|uniref:Uncharacterized protein n=1 Tax=Diaporthe vaccinii TaxID=105482 RepID=A0ABR4DTV3_9PEZI
MTPRPDCTCTVRFTSVQLIGPSLTRKEGVKLQVGGRVGREAGAQGWSACGLQTKWAVERQESAWDWSTVPPRSGTRAAGPSVRVRVKYAGEVLLLLLLAGLARAFFFFYCIPPPVAPHRRPLLFPSLHRESLTVSPPNRLVAESTDSLPSSPFLPSPLLYVLTTVTPLKSPLCAFPANSRSPFNPSGRPIYILSANAKIPTRSRISVSNDLNPLPLRLFNYPLLPTLYCTSLPSIRLLYLQLVQDDTPYSLLAFRYFYTFLISPHRPDYRTRTTLPARLSPEANTDSHLKKNNSDLTWHHRTALA